MRILVKLWFYVLITSRLGFANFGDDVENIAYLSARVLGSTHTHDRTLVSFPLYQLIALLYETASPEVQEEITQFFPKDLDSKRIAHLGSLLKQLDPQSKTELYSHLYFFLNQNQVPETALDTMEHVFFNHFVKQVKFTPDADSLDALNQQIYLDHNGKIKGPLKDKKLYNTVAFLVATLYINTPWRAKFSESTMLFNKQAIKKSFKGDAVVKYYKDETKIIVHIPAGDNIFLAIKMHFDGSITAITPEDLSAELRDEKVILELPEFTIENSIDLIEKLKELLPLTFSALGFKTFLLNNQENVIIEEFRQSNKLEVTLSGIKAESVTVAQMVSRCKGADPKENIQINRPFSFLLYKAHDNKEIKNTLMLPLLNGEVWDPQSLRVISPSLKGMPVPADSVGRSFFKLLDLAFQGRKGESVWGEHSSTLSPLSILIALNSLKKIYNVHNETNAFLSKIGYEIGTVDDDAEQLMRNDIVSLRAEESIKAVFNGDDFNNALIRLMDVNDDIKSALQESLEGFFAIFSLSDTAHHLTPINIKNSDVVFQLTPAQWKKIDALTPQDLQNHLLGKKNQFISELSYELLNQDDANFLYFLKYLLTKKIVQLTDERVEITQAINTSEKLLKLIKSAYFILKNKRVLMNLPKREKSRILGLTTEQAKRINSEDLSNLTILTNTLAASPANVHSTLLQRRYDKDTFLSEQTIKMSLRWLYTFDEGSFKKQSLLEGTVRGIYHETEQGITAAIPAYGDLLYIVQVNHNPDDYMKKPLVSFQGGQERQFFISMPAVKNPPPSVATIVLPFISQPVEIHTTIDLRNSVIGGAPKLIPNPEDPRLIVGNSFSYAIAKKIHAPDGSVSYAILVTGIYKP